MHGTNYIVEIRRKTPGKKTLEPWKQEASFEDWECALDLAYLWAQLCPTRLTSTRDASDGPAREAAPPRVLTTLEIIETWHQTREESPQ